MSLDRPVHGARAARDAVPGTGTNPIREWFAKRQSALESDTSGRATRARAVAPKCPLQILPDRKSSEDPVLPHV